MLVLLCVYVCACATLCVMPHCCVCVYVHVGWDEGEKIQMYEAALLKHYQEYLKYLHNVISCWCCVCLCACATVVYVFVYVMPQCVCVCACTTLLCVCAWEEGGKDTNV
jgi:hypothetical protein